jgi:hypothetical protein
MTQDVLATKCYCNVLARERGLDPVGHAGHFDDAMILEVPLPWKSELYSQAGALPQQVIDLFSLWLEQYHAGKGYPHRPLLIAPDAAYTPAGMRRVLFYTRPPGLMARFDKVEYLVPQAEMGALAWAWYEDRPALPHFEQYRVPEADHIRDVLVCTHGTIDAACAKFGFPLYRHLRDHYSSTDLRVWRVSHFGGHVFAPTLMDMPWGHYWAYIDAEQAAPIVQHQADAVALRGHYRGWAGVAAGFVQAAECDLWQAHGWEWFDYRKSGEVVAHYPDAENPTAADVRITYSAPDDDQQYVADYHVEMTHTVETEPQTNQPRTYAYPQYRATRLK